MASTNASVAEASHRSRTALSSKARAVWEETARREGTDNGLWKTATNMCSTINKRCSVGDYSDDKLSVDLHDLWYLYYQASKHTSSASANQDRLAFQILQTREQDATALAALPESSRAGLFTSGSQVWEHMPFFAADMVEFWKQDCAGMSAEQRLNVATFLAKLASVGLVEEKLCMSAFHLFRDALETARPLGQLGSQDDEDTKRSMHDLTIAALLPAINAWLFHAGRRIIQLSETRWSRSDRGEGRLGPLVRDAAVLEETGGGGFSPKRWMYWLKRLEEIRLEARRVGEDDLGDFVWRMMDNMLLIVDETDSVLRAEVIAAAGQHRFHPSVHMHGPCREEY